jgi:nucleotide-binding universal stress UspA family protein
MTRLFRKVLVPHDFSPQATQALRAAAELAARDRGRLSVLHAVPPVYPVAGLPPVAPAEWFPPPVASPDLIATERRRLEGVVAREVPRGLRVPVECRVVIGDPFASIMSAARGVTAIVMATLGRTGLPHLLLGSVAEKVVRHSPVPVLTVRPRVLRKRSASRRPRARSRRRRSGS